MSAAEGFEYRELSETIIVTHNGRIAAKLKGDTASHFLRDIEHDDPQLVMARITGNYKRGNERTARQHPRNGGH